MQHKERYEKHMELIYFVKTGTLFEWQFWGIWQTSGLTWHSTTGYCCASEHFKDDSTWCLPVVAEDSGGGVLQGKYLKKRIT